jgi:hypothetical protein
MYVMILDHFNFCFFMQDEARVTEARLWIEAVTGESFSIPGNQFLDSCFLFPLFFLSFARYLCNVSPYSLFCWCHLLLLCILFYYVMKDDFHESLKDGVLLCALLNAIKPGTIPEKKINKSKMPFKCMENITAFIKASRELGVPEPDLFETQDLWGAKVCEYMCAACIFIYRY